MFWKMLHLAELPLQRKPTLLSLDRTLRIHSGIRKSVSEKRITLRGDQPTVDFDTPANCRLFVTKMKAMDFQDEIPSIVLKYLNDQYVPVFNLNATWYGKQSKPRINWIKADTVANFCFTSEKRSSANWIRLVKVFISIENFEVICEKNWIWQSYSPAEN